MAASTNIPDAITGEPVLFTMDVIVAGAAAASIIQIAGIVDPTSVSGSGGETDGEGIPLGNGGRAWKQNPQGDFTVEFDCYTVGVFPTTGSAMLGLEQYFDGQALDSTEAIASSNTRWRNLARISFMQTEDATVTSATAAVAVAKWARRETLANCRFTKLEWSYSDSIYKVSVGLKAPAFKKDATANKKSESGDGSAATNSIPALAAYTTAVNF